MPFDLVRLRRAAKPFRLYWFPRLRSTNDHAAELRRRGELFAPAVVVTGRQTAGRGRGANRWWSSPGVLTVTFALAIEEHLAPHQLPLVAGLAVRAACAALCGEEGIQLKWPNDVVFRGRKLAGLLCERMHRVDLIGLGLNVQAREAPAALRGRMASLSEIAGRELDMTEVLATAGRHLLRMMSRRKEHPFAGLLKEYDRHHALVGKRVRVRGFGEEEEQAGAIAGRCLGLDGEGRLLVKDGREVRRVVAGHVEVEQ